MASTTKNQKRAVMVQVFGLREAKRSGQLSKIYSAYGEAIKSEHVSSLVPTTFHSIASLYRRPPVGGDHLGGELIWGSVVISRAKHLIVEYLGFKKNVQARILESKWSEAANLTTAFELTHGASVVSKEISIAIKQQAEGTIRQVAYSRKLQAQSGQGAVSNFLHFCSERNEDRLALSSLRRTFRENYSPSSIDELISAILYWHALRQIPSDTALLAKLLDYECTGSLFDYYEVYVASLLSLAFCGGAERGLLSNSLQRIVGIGDIRVVNALAVAEQRFSSKPSSGRSLHSVLSKFEGSARESHGADEGETVRQIIENFSEQKEFSILTRRLVHKFGINFYFLDYFQAVFGHLEHKASSACFDHAVAPLVAAQFAVQSTDLLLACSRRHIKSRKPRVPGFQCEDAEAKLSEALDFLDRRDADSLIELMSTADEMNGLDKTHLLLLTISACIASKRLVEAVSFAYVLSEVRLDALLMLPLVSTLEQVYPKRLEHREAAIFSIVASRLLLLEDSDRVEDKLMVAAECALQNLDGPPDWYAEDLVNRSIWTTFLHEVMEVQNMLLIDGVDSLRQALDLRLTFLRQLIELNPDEKDVYQEEVRDITFNLSVEDGTKHINTSRLYVNVQGLQKWATEHCQDDFERYKELVMGEAFAEELVAKANTAGASLLEQIASIPVGVADDQLVSLLFRMRNAYLSDPRNGLDAFISLRVRHGSLAGTLSRGLDTRQLLLLRKGERGSYEPPQFWIDQLSVPDVKRHEFTSAFARFATKFHSSIEELLRNRLRVRSERNPDGMIAADFTDYHIKGLKHDIVKGLTFDSFLAAVFLTYKNSVSQYLAGLRDYLKGDFLRKSSEDLQILTGEIEEILDSTESIGKIRDAITSARIDLQSSIKVVNGWLEIAQKDDLSQIFSIYQAAQIGINYTKQVRPDFSPDPEITGDHLDSVRLTGASLIAIVDVLFILLDNVYKHAGNPNERKICLNFDLSENGVIRIRMTNDLDESKNLAEISSRLEAARRLLVDGESERKLTEEEKSGIPKLSRLVIQERSDALFFEMLDREVIFTVLLGYSSLELPQ